MFEKILIANRGEIACRIIKTARAMGVQTVAVYSDADANALHASQADQAVRLGPAPVADSYLRGDLIIAAALETGADAIHPGYGFLSENPEFVDAVTAAGLIFIGPSAKAIRAMGLKDAAKVLMEHAGVPVVPGYHGDNQDDGFLSEQAEVTGYPVLIKAVAGGGGKGMRLVETADDFQDALSSARAEAKTAFGNADVLIEKYIQSPRHIEMQVFGDGANAVHLFERDCSLQRRHQKVIEEAPAPGMTQDVRNAMGDAAVRAAKAIGYAGAGTIEFIVDGANGLRPDGFWFMEMNTRLQVEHPVTEAIAGIDLVEWQLRVAAGEALPAKQDDIQINGHAFEARLYAEDVPAGFLPATGTLDHVVFPNGARIDTGVEAGSDVSPWYDPMIAKVTVHGSNRERALAKLSRALAQTEIAGVVTNLGFLQRLAAHDDFKAEKIDTGLIARDEVALTRAPKVTAHNLARAVAAGLEHPPEHAGFSLWGGLGQTQSFRANNDVFDVVTVYSNGKMTVETPLGTTVLQKCANAWWAGNTKLPNACRIAQNVTIFGNEPMSFDIPNPLERGGHETGGDDVKAPMPGLVQHVAVMTGDVVKAGDRMVVLEAMKMEHVLRAPRGGVVALVAVAAGDQVNAGLPLITLEDDA